MKIKLAVSSATAIIVSILANIYPIFAQSRHPGEFYCGTNGNHPATLVRHPNRGEVVFINWKSDYFGASGWTPGVRCAEVSQRFQYYQQQDLLNYVVPGSMNGYPVLCAARNINDKCSGRLLFMLKLGADPSAAIAQIYDLNLDANASPLNQEASGLLTNKAGEKVLHINSFLDGARVSTSVDSPIQAPNCDISLFGPCN